MAHLKIENVSIKGITSCVPHETENNRDYPLFKEGEAEKVISSTGILKRHIASSSVTASDLCYEAANDLIKNLNWDKKEIECLIFVSQSRDYILPATACILQSRLDLPNSCASIDISFGCSGWIYGMSVISSMISSGSIKKGILLVGDTPSKFKSRNDKTAWPLFGDAGTATALEYNEHASSIYFSLFTDGSKFKSIIIPDGGCRSPFTVDSLKEQNYGDGISRTNLDSVMDGINILSFALLRAPEVVQDILIYANKSISEIDFYLFHQANMFLNEKIRKKLNIPAEKVPYSLQEFGNTSCSTIPLTIDYCFKDVSLLKDKEFLATSFGVGLSWGSLLTNLNQLEYLNLKEYK